MMCSTRYFSVFLLLLFSTTCTQTRNCSIKESSKTSSCFCDDLDSGLNGWTYTCIDSLHFETLFSVKYVVDESFTFQCGEHEPHYQSILQQVDLAEIQTFSFKTCPLPNTSYSDIIPYSERYPVEQIKVEATRGDRTFTAEMFGNMSESLKSVILSGNHIEMLPESLFSNFTHLKYLSLSDNKLKTLPQDIFADASNLMILEITNNVLESLPADIFQNLRKLETLYLYKNNLKDLPDSIFKNLVHLQVLDLADNHLMLLPEGIFSGLTSMIHVRLRANWLVTVPADLFNGSINLKDIDLSLNRFMEPLPEHLLFGLSKLENMIIHNCNLSQIHENFLVHSPNLTNLNLERNSLTLLPEDIFRNNSNLKEVNLNFNLLNKLPDNLFPNQMHLEKFSIFKNNISFLPDGIFQRARKIRTLVMGSNRIRNASQVLFRDLPNLETLDLSVNNLTYFRLDGNEVIKRIDLSYNGLTEMPPIQWTRHLRLESFNLEHNKISFLSIPVLYSTNKGNPILNLAHNNIRSVSTKEISLNDELIKELPSKDYNKYVETEVILNSNPFACDCHLYNFYDYVKESSKLTKKSVRFNLVNNLTCQEPHNLKGKKVMSILPSQFICELKEKDNCSYPCQCYIRIHDNSNVMNCSHRNLKTLPTLIPHNTNTLLFQENLLTSMKDFNKEMWENLTELFLGRNLIENLDNWKIPVNLKNISVENNRITNLPLSFMTFVSDSKPLNISMSGNPFNCNCSAVNFKKWLAENYQLLTDVQNIMCANQVNMNGTPIHSPILTTPDDVLCPIDDWPYKLHLISVTVTCVVLALLLFTVSALYYRNKQTVIAYVYIHMYHVFTCFFSEEEFDEDKIFDAFVSYSSSDRDVAHLMIEELENKEPHFRLCIHDRNWIAGNPISWNIFNSVQNSRRTILVISKEFLTSMWFQVEFHTAYYQMLEDKIDRLIIIVKGELPPKETMDKDLQYLLSTKTYLVWEEKWFWEKLRYALPHKKHQIVSNDVLALKDRPASEKIKPIENQIAILSSENNKAHGKVQGINQNHTNSTISIVNKDSSTKK